MQFLNELVKEINPNLDIRKHNDLKNPGNIAIGSAFSLILNEGEEEIVIATSIDNPIDGEIPMNFRENMSNKTYDTIEGRAEIIQYITEIFEKYKKNK